LLVMTAEFAALGGPDEPGHDGRERRGPKGLENGCGCWHAMAFSWFRWVLPAESHRSRLRQPISQPSWPNLFGPPRGRRARCRRQLVVTAGCAAMGGPDEPGHDGREVVAANDRGGRGGRGAGAGRVLLGAGLPRPYRGRSVVPIRL